MEKRWEQELLSSQELLHPVTLLDTSSAQEKKRAVRKVVKKRAIKDMWKRQREIDLTLGEVKQAGQFSAITGRCI